LAFDLDCLCSRGGIHVLLENVRQGEHLVAIFDLDFGRPARSQEIPQAMFQCCLRYGFPRLQGVLAVTFFEVVELVKLRRRKEEVRGWRSQISAGDGELHLKSNGRAQWHTRMRSALDCEGEIKTKIRRWNLVDSGSRNRHRSFALLAPRGCPGFLVSSIPGGGT
jgi:hypothetical protein